MADDRLKSWDSQPRAKQAKADPVREDIFRKTARDPYTPLAGVIRPFGRLGALVFRLTAVRKSHIGLAAPRAKTRIAGSAPDPHVWSTRRKNVGRILELGSKEAFIVEAKRSRNKLTFRKRKTKKSTENI
ncbi:MAG: hypothetical protein AAB403_16850 [Planctomycetota bacterium]